MSPADESTFQRVDQIKRDLMMPTGEPIAAVIGAALLVAFTLFAGAFAHPGSGANAPHAAAAARQLLQSGGAHGAFGSAG